MQQACWPPNASRHPERVVLLLRKNIKEIQKSAGVKRESSVELVLGKH
jgi:hypothetical protein